VNLAARVLVANKLLCLWETQLLIKAPHAGEHLLVCEAFAIIT